MEFYSDIIDKTDNRQSTLYKYHSWNLDSIKNYWKISTNNPFVVNQFYPIEYWIDLIEWSQDKINENQPMPFSMNQIVDIGCGNGNLIHVLQQYLSIAKITGIDLSQESMMNAKKRFSSNNNIDFKVGSINDLPFDNESIDLIVCTEVLEHTFIDTFESSFAEISRVLRPGGYYLASVPFNEKITFVPCPHCNTVFTPYQHMIFNIEKKDISMLCNKNNLHVVDYYQSMDKTIPESLIKRILKGFIVKHLTQLASRLFHQKGVTGFIAMKETKKQEMET
jgi:ubiquinone/menaquinone biosynthesis C-methylase UbiE